MKKIIAMAFIAASLAACNDGGQTNKVSNSDSSESKKGTEVEKPTVSSDKAKDSLARIQDSLNKLKNNQPESSPAAKDKKSPQP